MWGFYSAQLYVFAMPSRSHSTNPGPGLRPWPEDPILPALCLSAEIHITEQNHTPSFTDCRWVISCSNMEPSSCCWDHMALNTWNIDWLALYRKGLQTLVHGHLLSFCSVCSDWRSMTLKDTLSTQCPAQGAAQSRPLKQVINSSLGLPWWLSCRLKICLPVQERQVWSLVWEDPLEKEMATSSSILAWEIPWAEEPGGL